jgi:serine/threonine protein kinase
LKIDAGNFDTSVINSINNQINRSTSNSNIFIYSKKIVADAIINDININALASKKNQTLFLFKGKGGEGTVFVSNDTKLAVKIYNKSKSNPTKEQKLKSMVKAGVNVHGICWPVKYINFRDRAAYVMRAAIGTDLHLLLRKKTLEQYSNIDRLFLIKIAIDLLNKIVYLHQKEILIGDINLMNILVDIEKSETYLIDTDSFQFDRYPCPVGSVIFTAPELQHTNFSNYFRTKQHEYFAIATLLFIIFHGGKAPYAHIGGAGPAEDIKNRNFPYPYGNDFHYETPKGVYENMWSMLPIKMRQAFYDIFKKGKRISPEDWKNILVQYKKKLDNGADKKIFPDSNIRIIGRTSIAQEGEGGNIGDPENIINESGEGFAIMELSSKAVKLLINNEPTEEFVFRQFYKKVFFTNTGNLLKGEIPKMQMYRYNEKVIPRIIALKDKAIEKGSKYLYAYAGSVYRAASNREDLIDMIKKNADISIKIIDDKDESQFNYLAQTNTIPELLGSKICLFDFGASSFRINLFDENGNKKWSQKCDFGYESLKKLLLLNNDSGVAISSAFEIFDTLITNEQKINTIINNCNKIKDIPFQFVGLGGPFTKVTGFKPAIIYHKRKVEGDIFENKKIEAEEILNEKVNNLGEVVFKEGRSFKEIGLINDYFTLRVSLPIINKILDVTMKKEVIISGTSLWYGLYYHHLTNKKEKYNA